MPLKHNCMYLNTKNHLRHFLITFQFFWFLRRSDKGYIFNGVVIHYIVNILVLYFWYKYQFYKINSLQAKTSEMICAVCFLCIDIKYRFVLGITQNSDSLDCMNSLVHIQLTSLESWPNLILLSNSEQGSQANSKQIHIRLS